MEVGDLVIYKFATGVYEEEDCQSDWGLGVVLTRNWNVEGFWENIVWFNVLDRHVLCDDIDLKKVA